MSLRGSERERERSHVHCSFSTFFSLHCQHFPLSPAAWFTNSSVKVGVAPQNSLPSSQITDAARTPLSSCALRYTQASVQRPASLSGNRPKTVLAANSLRPTSRSLPCTVETVQLHRYRTARLSLYKLEVWRLHTARHFRSTCKHACLLEPSPTETEKHGHPKPCPREAFRNVHHPPLHSPPARSFSSKSRSLEGLLARLLLRFPFYQKIHCPSECRTNTL